MCIFKRKTCLRGDTENSSFLKFTVNGNSENMIVRGDIKQLTYEINDRILAEGVKYETF